MARGLKINKLAGMGDCTITYQRGLGGGTNNQIIFTAPPGKIIDAVFSQFYVGEFIVYENSSGNCTCYMWLNNQNRIWNSPQSVVSATPTQVILTTYRTPHNYNRNPDGNTVSGLILRDEG